jgi:hypothetical protein
MGWMRLELKISQYFIHKHKQTLNTWLQKNGIILARMELNAYFCKRKVKIGETNYGIRQGTIHSGAHSRVRGSS